MIPFPLDAATFDTGTPDGCRIVPGTGLRVDFDEAAAGLDTLGLWHLHDGGCAGEGTGLVDASGGGRDMVSYGAQPVEAGYRFVADEVDWMDAAFDAQPERGRLTLELWFADLGLAPGDAPAVLATLFAGAPTYLELRVRRMADPEDSQIWARLQVGGTVLGLAQWRSAEADAVLAGGEPVHVAAVLDAPGSLTLFVGGAPRASEANVGPLPADHYVLRLGGRFGQVPDLTLTGTLDEVRLTADALYAAPLAPRRLREAGRYTSPTLDGVRPGAAWTDLAVTETVPPGCATAWDVRAADTVDGFGAPEAAWVPYAGSPAALPRGRYLQWACDLAGGAGGLLTPTVAAVEAWASEAGYAVYHAAGGPEALTYETPLLVVGPGVTAVDTGPLAAGAVHGFGVRPTDADGRATPVTSSEARLELDAEGAVVADRPPAPVAAWAAARPAGAAEVGWRYRAGPDDAAPAVFRVYGDGGTGTVDEETPLAEVAHVPGRTHYRATVTGLAAGAANVLRVRAETAAGLADAGEALATVTPDATSPEPVEALEVEVVL